MENQVLKQSVILTLPVLAGYLFLGATYGIIMQSNGHSLLITQATSLFIFAGALQFAAIPMFLGAFNPLSAILLAFLVNVRHLFYGLSMIPKYSKRGLRQFIQIFTMADEAFSIQSSMAKETTNQNSYLLVGVLCYLYWQVATLLGYLIGNALPMQIQGLPFVLTALFFVLFLRWWDQKEARPHLMLGVIATAFSLWVITTSQFILNAMIMIVIVLSIEYWRKGKSQ